MTTTTFPEELTLDVHEQIEIGTPLERAFDAMLARLGPKNEAPSGEPMSLKLEPRPGGRWFRDLGNEQGHLWGHVQVIKPPTLLEIVGPMFMSYPAISHVQFRLAEQGDGSLLTLRHQALGLIDPAHREGVKTGWKGMMDGIKTHAEAG